MKLTDELRSAATEYMEQFRIEDKQHDHVHPWVGARIGFIAGAQWGHDRGRKKERERILNLLKEVEPYYRNGSPSVGVDKWLESKLAEADAKEEGK